MTCEHLNLNPAVPTWDADNRVAVSEVACAECGQTTEVKVPTPSPGRHFFTVLGRKTRVEHATEGDLRVIILEEDPDSSSRWRQVGKMRVRSNFQSQEN